MQRRLRCLSLSLVAGVLAVIAAALPLVVQSSPPQQIQYVKVTRTDVPGMMRMFVHNTSSTATVTVSSSRQRTDSGDETSDIIQCDLKRIVHLDNKNKTYYAMTFEQMQAAMQQAMQNMPKAKSYAPPPPASAAPIKGAGSITLSMNTREDPQTQTILGMTAHHVTTTIAGASTGSGDCPNFSASLQTDEWYIPNEVSFSCPVPMPPMMPRAPGGPAGGNPMAGNPCFGQFQVQANGKARTADRFPLKQDVTMDFGGFKFTTHEEVTKYAKSPYDPAYFDVPAGYTQIPPPGVQGGG